MESVKYIEGSDRTTGILCIDGTKNRRIDKCLSGGSLCVQSFRVWISRWKGDILLVITGWVEMDKT